MPTPSAGSKANHTRPCLHFQHKTRVLSKSYKRCSRGCWGAAWGALHNGPPELGVQTRHACLSPGWARAGAAAPGGELTGPALTTRGDKCLCLPPRPEPVRPRHNVQLSVSPDEAPGGPGGRGRLPTWQVQDPLPEHRAWGLCHPQCQHSPSPRHTPGAVHTPCPGRPHPGWVWAEPKDRAGSAGCAGPVEAAPTSTGSSCPRC